MPIIIPPREDLSGSDADRERYKRYLIKSLRDKDIKELILGESILEHKVSGRKVKVPVKRVSVPEFCRGSRSGGKGQAGIGSGSSDGQSGPAKEGQEIGSGLGGGDGTDEEFNLVEIDLEELLDIIVDDKGLPNLKELPGLSKMPISGDIKINDLSVNGPSQMLWTEEVGRQGVGRFFAFLNILISETGRSELDCFGALKLTGGDVGLSLDLLKSSDFNHDFLSVEPFPIIENEDMVYFAIEDNIQTSSDTTIVLILDTSGSMMKDTLYFVKLFLYNMKNVFHRLFPEANINFIFIVHDQIAYRVDEKTCFAKEVKGGTHCYAPYEMVLDIITEEKLLESNNIFVYHFTDGDDSSAVIQKSVYTLEKLVKSGINMFSLCITVEKQTAVFSGIIEQILKSLPVSIKVLIKHQILLGRENFPFLGLRMTNENSVNEILSELLNPNLKW